MASDNVDHNGISFLQWALPKLGYRWDGFSKPRGQVLKRIRERLHKLELTGGYAEYREHLNNYPEEWKVLDRLCYVTISKFFRDRKMWDYLRSELLPHLISVSKNGNLTAWSAGCCNGEEPYSLAIIWEQLSEDVRLNCTLRVLASDRYTKLLQHAQRGIYPLGALKELNEKEIERFFHEIKDRDSRYRISDRLRQNITFEKRNIRSSLPEGPFDIIFCRNLAFTYYDRQTQLNLLKKMKPLFTQESHLVIGSNESLPNIDWLQTPTHSHPVFYF